MYLVIHIMILIMDNKFLIFFNDIFYGMDGVCSRLSSMLTIRKQKLNCSIAITETTLLGT
jgi:hypothetical protein